MDSFLKFSSDGYFDSVEYYTNLATNIFRYYDKNKNNVLSLDEFQIMADELYEKTRIKIFRNRLKGKDDLHNEYRKMDSDFNGHISLNGIFVLIFLFIPILSILPI